MVAFTNVGNLSTATPTAKRTPEVTDSLRAKIGGRAIRPFIYGIVIAVACLIFFFAGLYLQDGALITVAPPKDIEIRYSDFIIVMLTCIAVLITILGVVIALLTVFGIRNVKVIATRQAYLAAKAELDNKDSSISKLILKVAERSAYQGIESIDGNGNSRGEFD